MMAQNDKVMVMCYLSAVACHYVGILLPFAVRSIRIFIPICPPFLVLQSLRGPHGRTYSSKHTDHKRNEG